MADEFDEIEVDALSPEEAEEILDRLGFARWKHWIVWVEYGWFWWLPDWLQSGIVNIWNAIACRMYGHELFAWVGNNEEPDTTCIHCGKDTK